MLLLKFSCIYSITHNQLSINDKPKNIKYVSITNDSQFIEFKKVQYDTIQELYLNILNSNIDLKFDNFNHIEKTWINCKNFELFDTVSPKFLNNVSFIHVHLKTIEKIPKSLLNFSKLIELSIISDTTNLRKIELDNIFGIKNLLVFGLNIKSFISEISIGKYSNLNYEYIEIGGRSNGKYNVGVISFDSSFFENTFIEGLNLHANEIENFVGSNSFSVNQLQIDCSNIQKLIKSLNINSCNCDRNKKNEFWSITLYDCSKFENIPSSLLKMNFRKISLFNAYNISSIDNIDYFENWPKYIYIENPKLSKKFFKEIPQTERLYLTIVTTKVKYRWIKHFYRIGELKIIYPNKKAKSEWDYSKPKKLPLRVRRKLDKFNPRIKKR